MPANSHSPTEANAAELKLSFDALELDEEKCAHGQCIFQLVKQLLPSIKEADLIKAMNSGGFSPNNYFSFDEFKKVFQLILTTI